MQLPGPCQTTAMNRIDEIMEQASLALVAMQPIQCELLCVRALDLALKASDFGRISRIALPLQEARRLRRQIAADTGIVRIIDTQAQLRAKADAVCYLFQPPLIAADARTFRESCLRRGIPVFVLTREPMTKDGSWPVVAVGALSIRTKVKPPVGVNPKDSCVTRDEITAPIEMSWFEAAAEALGDVAIASVDAAEPASHRVEDMIDRLDALNEHEKLHQALEHTAIKATQEPAPNYPRRRGLDNSCSF